MIDQDWARREGMVAFAGHPLIVDGRVVGVMAVFARHALSDAAISAMASVADHLALGMERHRSAEALRTADERMRFALEAAGVGIWDSDFSTEHRTIRPDGTERWLSGAGRVLLGEHGEWVRAVGITQDATERHTLEEQYRQAQKMETVGRLAGGVAHDFNNLLTVILGYCELLLADLDPGDPRQADIAEIQNAGTRASGLTRQLLAFSRKQIAERTPLDLNAVIIDIRPMLARLIRADVKVMLGLRPELAP